MAFRTILPYSNTLIGVPFGANDFISRGSIVEMNIRHFFLQIVGFDTFRKFGLSNVSLLIDLRRFLHKHVLQELQNSHIFNENNRKSKLTKVFDATTKLKINLHSYIRIDI